jgi:Protein of unknown function (DUF2490)
MLLLGASVFAQARSEFQEWNEVQLIYPLLQDKDAKGKTIDRITATFSGITRLGQDHLSAFVDNRAGLTLDFRANKFVHVYGAYQYRSDESLPGPRGYEQRLSAALGLEKTWEKFTFKERNMYEHSFRANRVDSNRYRQRFQASYSITDKDKKELFAPYVSEEGYWDLDAHSWARNEFYVGITKKFNKHFSADFFYIRLDTLPVNANGIGTTLKFKLK